MFKKFIKKLSFLTRFFENFLSIFLNIVLGIKVILFDVIINCVWIDNSVRPDWQRYFQHGKLTSLIKIKQILSQLLFAVSINPLFIISWLLYFLVKINLLQNFIYLNKRVKWIFFYQTFLFGIFLTGNLRWHFVEKTRS